MRLDDPHIFSGSPSWPPSTESLGEKGLVPASISPPAGVGTELGIEVLSNGVLNECPSFSVNSYALRDNQLQCLEMIGKASTCRMGALQAWRSPFTIHVVLNVPGWETRLQSFPIQVPLDPWVGWLYCAGLQILGAKSIYILGVRPGACDSQFKDKRTFVDVRVHPQPPGDCL